MHKSLNGRHVTTSQFAKGAERNRRRPKEEEMQERAERVSQAYGRTLAAITFFKYLGQVLAAAGEN